MYHPTLIRSSHGCWFMKDTNGWHTVNDWYAIVCLLLYGYLNKERAVSDSNTRNVFLDMSIDTCK